MSKISFASWMPSLRAASALASAIWSRMASDAATTFATRSRFSSWAASPSRRSKLRWLARLDAGALFFGKPPAGTPLDSGLPKMSAGAGDHGPNSAHAPQACGYQSAGGSPEEVASVDVRAFAARAVAARGTSSWCVAAFLIHSGASPSCARPNGGSMLAPSAATRCSCVPSSRFGTRIGARGYRDGSAPPSAFAATTRATSGSRYPSPYRRR
mmetsp:Transcript_22917/g.78404  ORF Transcript_22917/g.78404 Transcript_22917/m.78404 type:complete len:213 (-) Transcript_22917:836-1474(-)